MVGRAVLQPDADYPGLWRVVYPDGPLSDTTSLTKARDDAVISRAETARRCGCGAHRSSQAPLKPGGEGGVESTQPEVLVKFCICEIQHFLIA
jgi:hypothetical protein